MEIDPNVLQAYNNLLDQPLLQDMSYKKGKPASREDQFRTPTTKYIGRTASLSMPHESKLSFSSSNRLPNYAQLPYPASSLFRLRRSSSRLIATACSSP